MSVIGFFHTCLLVHPTKLVPATTDVMPLLCCCCAEYSQEAIVGDKHETQPGDNQTKMKATLFVVATVLLFCGALFGVDSPPAEMKTATSVDYRLWVAIATGCGTILTGVVNLVRWIRDRSNAARKLENVSYALKLKDFIEASEQLTTSVRNEVLSQRATAIAHEELSSALSSLDTSPKPIPRWRRLGLLYAPRGWRAWIAHSLFYGSLLLLALFIVAVMQNDTGLESGELFGVFALLLLIPIPLQRWGALEYRFHAGIRLMPTRRGPITWYPANSGLGFLAHGMILYGLFLLAIATGLLKIWSGVPFLPSPGWKSTIHLVFTCAFIPVGYCWSEAEFRYSTKSNLAPSLSRFPALLAATRRTHEVVGVLALALTLVWCFVLLYDLRHIFTLATLPDGDGTGQVGIALAVCAITVQVIFVGVWPLIAVYRGLWSLYEDAHAENASAAEVTNG